MAAAAPEEGAAGTTTNQVAMKVRYGDVDDSNFAIHGRAAMPLLFGPPFLLVALVALVLYLRWSCARRRRDAADREASSSAAVAASLTVLPGLDADAINGLPVTLYSPPPSASRGKNGGAEEDGGEREAADCSICISALVAGDKVKALPPCGHCFHPDCVDAWLRSHPSCPLCRTGLLTLTEVKPVGTVDGSGDDDSPV